MPITASPVSQSHMIPPALTWRRKHPPHQGGAGEPSTPTSHRHQLLLIRELALCLTDELVIVTEQLLFAS